MNRAILLISVLAFVGCGDDGGATDAGLDSGVGTDGAADTGLDGAPPVDAGPTSELSVLCMDETGAPMEGVMLVFEAASGARFEGASDADGRFVFAGLPWSEAGSLTGVPPASVERATYSWVGLTEADADAQLNADGDLPRVFDQVNAAPERITISGTFTGFTDAGNLFNAYLNIAGGTLYNDVGPEYSFKVPAGVPFRMTGLEYNGTLTPRAVDQDLIAVTLVDSEALTEDTVIDIDLSDPEPFIAVSGSIPLPPAGHQLATGNPYYRNTSLESRFQESFGYPETMVTSADATSYEYEGVYWAVDGADQPRTAFSLRTATLFSSVSLDAYGEGVQDAVFLDPAIVVTPAFGEAHPLHDPVAVTTMHPDANTILFVLNTVSRVRWIVVAPLGATEVTIPELPTGVSESDVLGGTALTARVQLCDFIGEGPERHCQRSAVGRAFDIVP